MAISPRHAREKRLAREITCPAEGEDFAPFVVRRSTSGREAVIPSPLSSHSAESRLPQRVLICCGAQLSLVAGLA